MLYYKKNRRKCQTTQ